MTARRRRTATCTTTRVTSKRSRRTSSTGALVDDGQVAGRHRRRWRRAHRVLGLRDLILIVIGTVIGSGVFLVPGGVLRGSGVAA